MNTAPNMEELIKRIRLALQFGQSVETIHNNCIKDNTEEDIFLAYCAAMLADREKWER
jgi:transcriptional regulator